MRRLLTALSAVFVTAMLATATVADPLDGITIAPEQDRDGYDRSLYKHWVDADGDKEDARQEVLIEESLIPVTIAVKANGKRVVTKGLWVGPYCGFVSTDPGELDIDHMVPLKQAHISGAHAWTKEKRQDYANGLSDKAHLIATKGGCNRSKGFKDPAEWMPPNRTYWCQYLGDWIAIKKTWALSMDTAEAAAVKKGLQVCSKYKAGDRLEGRHN